MVEGQVTRMDREKWLTELMERHETELYRLCLLYLRDEMLAQDAVQETFVKAYKRADTFRGDCAESTWLTRIAINVCKDIRRGAWFRRVDRSVTPETLPDEAAPGAAENEALADAVQRLPRRQLEAVLLYYWREMPVEDIAAALRVTVPAVYARLDRARKTLRRQLKGGFIDEK